MPETKRPLKVFLCHAHPDRDAVHGLYLRLITDSVDAWLDKENLIGGQDWEFEIRRAVRESDVVIVCLSKQFAQKGFRQYEVRIALEEANLQPEGEIFIIPLRLEECNVPQSLRRWHWVDLFEGDGYERLMRALRARAGRIGVTLQVRRSWLPKITSPRAAQRKPVQTNKPVPSKKSEIPPNPGLPHIDEPLAHPESGDSEWQPPVEPDTTREAGIPSANLDPGPSTSAPETETRTARTVALKEAFSRSFTSFKLAISKAKPFFRIGGFLGIILALFWVGSWSMSQFPPFVPTATATASSTLRPGATVSFTNSPAALPSTQRPKSTQTKTRVPTRTRTLAPTTLPKQIADAKGVDMVLVPAGEFTMGSETGEGDEKPVHQVYLDDFYMDKFEVTNAFYKICVKAGVCSEPVNRPYIIGITAITTPMYEDPGFTNHPVVNVNFEQAMAYCEWRGARLPTEAEWEKAARGSDGRTYPWGEELGCSKANYGRCTGRPQPVGSYEQGKSIYGIYEMTGNASEFVADRYSSDYYETSPLSNPPGPTSGQSVVVRGGSWGYNTMYDSSLRASNRLKFDLLGTSYLVGFRCARSAP